MPWKEKGLETMRKDFVERVLAHEKSKSALCREYGISRPTGDKWIARYLAGEKLEDLSRAPKTRPNKTDSEMEQKIVNYRKTYPAIGAVKMRQIMENDHYTNLPSARTFNEIFKRNGLITKEASEAAKPHQRFEKNYPNEMWQADFKGDFRMENGVRCHPLNIIDDHSRMNLCCEPCLTETFREIKPHMALDLKVPASRYQKSPREYPSKISDWQYDSDLNIRKVKSSGYISINGQGYFLSEAFGNKQIAFRESSKGAHLINLYFRQFRIGQIDIEKRAFTFKKAYLIDGDPRSRAADQ